MSTHRFILAKRKGRSLPFLFMLGALLLMVPLLLPGTALAASRSVTATPPFTQPQIVDLAGVSVVRLSLTYIPAKGTPAVFCTTLGTIIASWPTQDANEKNNWVLTDGSLLNPSPKNACASGDKLISIKVFASNAFTNNQPASSQLGELNCGSTGTCNDVVNGTNIAGPVETILTPVNGAVLFSFHSTNPLPFVDVERANTTAPTSIEMTDRNGLHPTSPKDADPNTLQQFLTAGANTVTPGSAPTTPAPGTVSASAPVNEPGTPYIDGNGKITGAQLFNTTSLVTMTDMLNLEKQPAFPQEPLFSQKLNSNTLSKQWNAGITQYEQGNYRGAVQTLSPLTALNPAFQAPAVFVSKARAKIPTTNGTPGSTSVNGKGQSSASSFLGIPMIWLLVVGLIAAVLVLVLLFVLVSIIFGRKRIERKKELESFEADANKARQNVERMEEKPQPQQFAPPPQPYAGAAKYPNAAPPETRCPNCGSPVDEQATFCPNCRYIFTPADLEARHYPPPPGSPTIPILAPAQPQAMSISDVPTTEMSNKNGSLGSVSPESERTMPYNVQQLQGRNLGLAVITETNPGIKRKHKPNEDSLFAMQGERTHNSQPQQFGLFVVADGMGGHANGQDASRTAIQNIIDFMLPRISTANGLDDEGYKKLLMEGVQQANLAVHQRNLQDHADMGTTMTAALVVGSTAYVANVGDSRTYLYREPEGLRQITHDHSVVASLVDAGIIKPDDIYTHPKRNQIYRSLGEKPGVEVDAFIQPLQANDKL
ncbi:MAG TPA: protein phosphatase 2C domain-containing protein, partial [Ktedonobacteraceae bacterium]|nr:protein phosphatase 2C domain-containing protein [Ktedonobacteraceae bacterium]